jgi:uncharacterized membrane protein YukC
MGLRDRDYMRKKPDEGAIERYERDAKEAEYGKVTAKQKGVLRWIVIGFFVLLVLLFIVAALTSGS